jgi:hypothetical protein
MGTIRRVLSWLAVRFDADEESDGDGGGEGFVPSPLDRSVRYAHGGNDGGERALAEIRERAETIEEQRRRD